MSSNEIFAIAIILKQMLLQECGFFSTKNNERRDKLVI